MIVSSDARIEQYATQLHTSSNVQQLKSIGSDQGKSKTVSSLKTSYFIFRLV